MQEIFNDKPEQANISLEEVAEMSALFERVVKKQVSSNLAEMLMGEVDEDLRETRHSIDQFQQLTGDVYEGLVERLRLQEAQLVDRRRSLENIIESAKMLSATMGHLAVAKANLDLLDEIPAMQLTPDTIVEPAAGMSSFNIPVVSSQKAQKTISVELKLPEPVAMQEEVAEVEPAVEFIPLFKPAPPPKGIRLKPTIKAN